MGQDTRTREEKAQPGMWKESQTSVGSTRGRDSKWAVAGYQPYGRPACGQQNF